MSNAARKKNDRIDLRVEHKDKELIEHAASIAGMSASTFTLSTTLRAAREQISEYGNLTLSGTDRDRFVAAILNPPKANAALRSAMSRTKKLRG